MRQKKNPNYTWQPQAIITSQAVTADDLSEQLMVSNKQQIINKIPGYTATNMILKTMTWVLLIASAAILGVFFYILALQKLKQFGVLKAIGMSMGQITRIPIIASRNSFRNRNWNRTRASLSVDAILTGKHAVLYASRR